MPETYAKTYVSPPLAVHATDAASADGINVGEYRGGQLEYLTGTPADLTLYTSIDGTTYRKLQLTLRTSTNAAEAKDSVVKVQANYHSDLPSEIFGCRFVKFVGFTGTIRVHLKG